MTWASSSGPSCSARGQAWLRTTGPLGRGRSNKEFAARLGVVVEEADESEFWLDALRELNYGPSADVGRLHQESVELRAIFSASRTTVLTRMKESAKARRAKRDRS